MMISGERTVKHSYYDLDLRQYSKSFVRDFIETYRSLPALWKVRSKEYTDREEKKHAYDKLALKLKEVDPNADRDTVKRKINSMRTTFRKECRKVQSSRRGTGDIVYKPTLWYYDLLLFLYGQDTQSPVPIPVSSTPSSVAVGPVCKQETIDIEDTNDDFLIEDSQDYYSPNHSANENHSEEPVKERWPETHKSLPLEPVPTPPPLPPLPVETKDETVKQAPSIPGDEFDFIARTWAIKLKRMSPLQKLFAERLVNDVLFEGELGTLSRASELNVNQRGD